MLNFSETVFQQHLPFSLRKNTYRKFVENSAKTLGEIISFVAAFFAQFLHFSLATPYFEQLVPFKSKKFAQNPFCEKFP